MDNNASSIGRGVNPRTALAFRLQGLSISPRMGDRYRFDAGPLAQDAGGIVHRDRAPVAAGDEALMGRPGMRHCPHVDIGDVAHISDRKADVRHLRGTGGEQSQYGDQRGGDVITQVGPKVAVGLMTLSSV